jgi:hypothetical protein
MKTCSIEGCKQKHYAKGYCSYHYERFRKYGDPEIVFPGPRIGCLVEGCDGKHFGKGYCRTHYERFKKHGDLLKIDYGGISRKENPICSIEGCEKPVQARGWCSMHYKRWSEHGDPLADFTRIRDKCLVEGCSEPAHAQGYCLAHYNQWRRSGGFNGSVDMPKGSLEGTNCKAINVRRVDDLAHILFEKVVVEPEFHCWEWQGRISGGKKQKGRPILCVQGKVILASRLAYAVFVGPLPKGKLVCHVCDNGEHCVSPSHMYVGSHKTNQNDAVISRYLQKKGGLSKMEVRGIKLSFLENVANEKIAKSFGVPVKLLAQVRKKFFWAPEFKSEEKRLNSGVFLSEKDVVKIKKFLQRGVPGSNLAERFEVSRQLISQIKQGQAWAHIKI